MLLAVANGLVLLHGAGIIFVAGACVACVAGRLQLRRYRWAQVLFWGWLAGKVIGFFATGGCLFTLWEQQQRTAAGAPSYSGGYITHYLSYVGVYLTDELVRDVVAWPVLIVVFAQGYWTWQRKWRPILHGG